MSLDIEREFTPEPLNVAPSRIAVLDLHGQYVGLIGKGTQRLGFPTDILPHDTPIEYLEQNYGGLILSGSPVNSFAESNLKPDPGIWKSKIAKLGICAGLHVAITENGGTVEKGAMRQDGIIKTTVDTTHPIFDRVNEKQEGQFTHGVFVRELPDESWRVIGGHTMSDGTDCISAVACDEINYVGVQYHPEVFDATPEGWATIKNWCTRVAKLEPDNDFHETLMNGMIDKKRAEIRERIGDSHVIAFISGGVDSSVAVALAATEIAPEKLHTYYFDTGFMRDEDDQVVEMLTNAGISVERIDASEYFAEATITLDGITYGPLRNVSEPEIRRKIVGKAFIDLKHQKEIELGIVDAVLLQGTNAADQVESKRGIVSHHNQVVEALEQNPLEPLLDLYKDEIRHIGRLLGLPKVITERDPFPGPGTLLGIIDAMPNSVRGEINREIELFLGQFATNNRNINSPLGLVLPVKSAGVAGDERTYLNVAAISSSLDWRQLPHISTEVTNKFRHDINRIIVPIGQDIGNFTITEKDFEQERAIERQAHEIIRQERLRAGVNWIIEQCPIITFPLSFTEEGKRSIVVRPITTTTFMTVEALLPGHHLPWDFANRIAARILSEMTDISTVFWDITGKPPGRTEWM